MAKSLVFIDSRVVDYQTLVAGLGAGTDWVLIDAASDGVLQMQAALVGYRGLDSIQIISHGSAGTLLLGSTVLDSGNLSGCQAQLQAIGKSLAETGDLLLYGCNVGAGDIGMAFVSELAGLTGADVAASDDLSGSMMSGGDSQLEINIGPIETNALSLSASGRLLELISGTTGNDILIGTNANDILTAGGGNDSLDGGLGDDSLIGGDGYDMAGYISASGPVTVSLQTGKSSGAGGVDTLSGIEDLAGSNYDDLLTGDASGNWLQGLSGNDTLNGGDGNDVLLGGLGDDVLAGENGQFDQANYSRATGVVHVNLGTGKASGADGSDSLSGIEGVTGSDYNDTLTGDAVSNLLVGGIGNDTLAGGLGSDVLQGDGGNDTFNYSAASDSTAAAMDTIVDLQLGDVIKFNGLSGVTLSSGSYAYATSVAATASAISANAGVNNQAVFFSDGSDGYLYVKGAGTSVSFDGTLIKLVGKMTAPTIDQLPGVSSANTINGTSGNDSLTGTSENDILYGLNGNDILTAGGGSDTLVGGLGDDKLDGGLGDDSLIGGDGYDMAGYISASGPVTVSLQTGKSSGAGGVDTLSGIEDLAGSNYDDLLTGDASGNWLQGLSGNDTLNGGDGNDVLLGGLGDDVLAGENGQFDQANYSRATGVVHVNLGTGKASGADGSDSLSGIEGVTGSDYNDTLTGDAVSNLLVGGIGNDTLAGGSGSDVLQGDGGNDSFNYSAASDSSAAAMDTIVDLQLGDVINFNGLSGVVLSNGAYAYATSVAATASTIAANAGVTNQAVFFTDASDGYLYIKGAGTGVSFDGALIKLAGNITAPTLDQLAGVSANDSMAPVIASARVNASTLVLSYNEATTLDQTHVPAIGDFTVSGNTVTGVAVDAATKIVTLSLGKAVLAGATGITVSYTDLPGDTVDAIQDAAGNDAASLVAYAVVNTTPALTGSAQAETQYVSLLSASRNVVVPTAEVAKVIDAAGIQNFLVQQGSTLHLSGAKGANVITLEGYAVGDLAVSLSGTTVQFWANGREVASIATSAGAAAQTVIVGSTEFDFALAYSEDAAFNTHVSLGGQQITVLGVSLADLAPVAMA